MSKYHINPETQRPNLCKAVHQCRYASDGETPPHFDNKEDARAYVEESSKQEYSVQKMGGLRKNVNTQNSVHETSVGVNSGDVKDRVRAAQEGYGLEELVNDPDFSVRAEVAKQGYGLNKLVHDPDSTVRANVARQGYGLEELVNDPNFSVRAEVAKQGYGLDKLVKDTSPYVQETVAYQGYGLDTFIKDKSLYMRQTASALKHNSKMVDEYVKNLKRTSKWDNVKANDNYMRANLRNNKEAIKRGKEYYAGGLSKYLTNNGVSNVSEIVRQETDNIGAGKTKYPEDVKALVDLYNSSSSEYLRVQKLIKENKKTEKYLEKNKAIVEKARNELDRKNRLESPETRDREMNVLFHLETIGINPVGTKVLYDVTAPDVYNNDIRIHENGDCANLYMQVKGQKSSLIKVKKFDGESRKIVDFDGNKYDYSTVEDPNHFDKLTKNTHNFIIVPIESGEKATYKDIPNSVVKRKDDGTLEESIGLRSQ